MNFKTSVPNTDQILWATGTFASHWAMYLKIGVPEEFCRYYFLLSKNKSHIKNTKFLRKQGVITTTTKSDFKKVSGILGV